MLYDAFISYSHAADGKLAPAIQRALHTFAKPWYKLRTLRVFRDQTTLSATPGLWPAIEEALGQSEWFLYLASPQAAESPWVNQEISWWMTNRSYNRMLILLTDGDLAWDDATQDFDWNRTTAASRTLSGRFPSEPLYVDLRWAKSQDNLSLRHLQFRSAMLDIAAPIHARPKDELDGDDVRQQRKNKQWAWSAGIALIVLTIAASVAAVVALQQRDQAEARRQVASSRQVATQTLNYLGGERLDTALLLAIESRNLLSSPGATGDENTFDARSSLLSALTHGPVPIRSHMHGGNLVAFSPDGRTLASASGSQIIIWDVATGQPTGRPFASHDDAVLGLAFAPDGKTLVTSSRSDGNLRFWNLATRQPEGEPLTVHDGTAVSVAFSPDGGTFATGGGNRTVVFWNAATRQPIGEPLTGHAKNVDGLAFSPDGRTLASGSADGTVILWDVDTRTPLAPPLNADDSLGLYFGPVESVAFSPDGKRLAAGGGGVVLWEVDSRRPVSPLLRHPSGGVKTVAYSPDGRYVAAGSSGNAGTVMLWNATTFEAGPQPLLGHMNWIDSVAFSPDGSLLASASGDDLILTWDLTAPHRLASTFPGYAGPTYHVVSSPDGRLVAADICAEFQDSTSTGKQCVMSGIRVWDRVARKEIHTFRTARRGRPTSLAFVNGADILLSSSCAEGDAGQSCRGIVIESWDLRTGRLEQHRIDDDHPDLKSLVLSPDATIVAAGGCKVGAGTSTECSAGEIRLFDARAQRQLGATLMTNGAVWGLTFGPDGQTIVANSLNDVSAWNVSTGKPLWRPEAGATVAFTRDGKTIAVAVPPVSDPPLVVTLKSTTSNQPIGELILGDSDVVRDMAFSPDGKLLAVSSAGNNSESTVTLFDVQRRDRLGQPLRVQDGRIFALSFSPDGKTLITATEERGLLSWDVDPESWRLRACAIANRNLTYDEWTQFLGEQPYRATCPMLPIDPNMLEEGRRRARSGDVEGAITIFERYRELTSQLPFDPRKEALKFSVEELVANGRYLAESGDVDRGTVRLADAKRLDPSLPFDPGTEARRLAAPGLMASGEQLAQKGKIVEALQAFGRAQEYDPALQGSAAAWDTLCWNGALRGHAAQVLAACERAVAAAPENGRIRTSRGLAKAIVAKVDEATADFEAFLAWEEKEQSHRMGLGRRKWLQEQRARHQQWIAELRSGQNPFTPAELQRLLAEESPD